MKAHRKEKTKKGMEGGRAKQMDKWTPKRTDEGTIDDQTNRLRNDRMNE